MTDKELFMEVFNRLNVGRYGVTMLGTLVEYKGDAEFNTDGHNLAYNLYQLTSLLDKIGYFR